MPKKNKKEDMIVMMSAIIESDGTFDDTKKKLKKWIKKENKDVLVDVMVDSVHPQTTSEHMTLEGAMFLLMTFKPGDIERMVGHMSRSSKDCLSVIARGIRAGARR